MIRRAFAPALIVLAALGSHASVSLTTLTPQQVKPLDPRSNWSPQVTHSQIRGRTVPSLSWRSNSEVTYAIPSGQGSFSAVLLYADVNNPATQQDPAFSNSLYLRFLVDGKLVLETTMDDYTPPQRVFVPVSGGHHLMIAAHSLYSWESFVLADPQFSPQSQGPGSSFIVAAGQGFVQAMPLARQGEMHVYRPGESVPISAYFGGSETQAEVSMQVSLEQSDKPIPPSRIPVNLHAAGDGTYSGNAVWQVPQWRGPALLAVEENTGGKIVFRRSVRIAIAPEVNLGRIKNSTFALHTSSPGFIYPTEYFVNLWGAKWDRVFLRWEVVERNQGQYDFSRADEIIDTLLRQNVRVLGVIGELPPSWAGPEGPQHYEDWQRFAEQAVRHYQGKIQYWDVFNEIDVKYISTLAAADSESDLKLIKSGIQSVHKIDPTAKAVCCSPGTVGWLIYYKRLFDAGLLPMTDIVSLHPYESTAPEEKDGAFNYEERLAALEQLMRAYGQSKPIWSTEANWILGHRGEAFVNAPDLNEHTQAEYVVRVNLLSLAHSVPYFLHAPFYYSQYKKLLLDGLTAYANMASLLSDATDTRRLMGGPQVYAFDWDTPNGNVAAVWTTNGTANVSLSGLRHPRLLDFYGNPISGDIGSLTVSAAPTYVLAESATSPTVNVLKSPPAPAWHNLAPTEQWLRTKESRTTNVNGGVEITSQPTKYAYQLRSPDFPVAPGTCYIGRLKINLKQGAVMFFAVDKATGQRLGDPVYIAHAPDGVAHESQVRFPSGSARDAQLILAAGNGQPATTEFDALNPAQITQCP